MQADAALDLFRHAFRAERMAHAYLIVGAPRGAAGDLAIRVLQLLFCTGPEAPCGACERCRQVREKTWADVFWLVPEKKSRAIGVKEMRDPFLSALTQTSLAGGWKAGVILDADRMTDSAANALLKTLEEPPPQTLLLLLVETTTALLPTVVSRCQRVELPEAPELDEPWRGRLLEQMAASLPPGPLPAMAAAADLHAMLEDLKKAAEAEIKAEAAAVRGTFDEDDDVLEARISVRYRERRAAVLRGLLAWYRDLLVLRAGGDAALVRHQGQVAMLRERAARLTLGQALSNLEGVEELARQLDRSLPEEPVLAYWLDRLASGAGSLSDARR